MAAEGISVEVVDPRTLIPLDKELIIESVKKTGKVILVNDAYKTGGFIGEIASIITESEALTTWMHQSSVSLQTMYQFLTLTFLKMQYCQT